QRCLRLLPRLSWILRRAPFTLLRGRDGLRLHAGSTALKNVAHLVAYVKIQAVQVGRVQRLVDQSATPVARGKPIGVLEALVEEILEASQEESLLGRVRRPSEPVERRIARRSMARSPHVGNVRGLHLSTSSNAVDGNASF